MSRKLAIRVKQPSNKGGRWVVTYSGYTDVGFVRVHGTGSSHREATNDAAEKWGKRMDIMRRRVSRPTSQHQD